MRMPRSESGRVVIEVDPRTKKKLYANLALSGSTLKDWFSTVAEEYCTYEKSASLFQKDALIPTPTLAVGTSYRSQKKYSVVSMFSGCGGMDLGFGGGFEIFGKRYPKLPFEIIWANDLNEAACRTYKRNLGDHIHCGDVWSLISKIPKKADVLIGGFPCQDISINGKGVGVSGARSGLYRQAQAKSICGRECPGTSDEKPERILDAGSQGFFRSWLLAVGPALQGGGLWCATNS